MNRTFDMPQVTTVSELYAVAYEIETDAVERYKMLADQMQTHNNQELTRIFLDLARAEGIHADEIRRLADDAGVSLEAPPIRAWRTESPEAVELNAAHYLMTPKEALQMALGGEERALAFWTELAAATMHPGIKKLAEEFVDEEYEHVELCHRLIRRYAGGPEAQEELDPPWEQD